jgi:hypothetical protein
MGQQVPKELVLNSAIEFSRPDITTITENTIYCIHDGQQYKCNTSIRQELQNKINLFYDPNMKTRIENYQTVNFHDKYGNTELQMVHSQARENKTIRVNLNVIEDVK